jgi:ASC-1-like (ASCH) protein
LLCGLGPKLVQAHIGTNQNTIEKRSTRIKIMTEKKFKVGDLIMTKDEKVPLVVTDIRAKPLISELFYVVTRDMEDFLEIYTDWADENMVLCEH